MNMIIMTTPVERRERSEGGGREGWRKEGEGEKIVCYYTDYLARMRDYHVTSSRGDVDCC